MLSGACRLTARWVCMHSILAIHSFVILSSARGILGSALSARAENQSLRCQSRAGRMKTRQVADSLRLKAP